MKFYTFSIFRCCVTGVTQYQYCLKGVQIASASAMVLPNYPVTVSGSKITLHSERNLEQTIVPGCSNSIMSDTQEVAKVVYLGPGRHLLQIGSVAVQCVREENETLFFLDDKMFAILRTVCTSSAPTEHWELRQILLAQNNIPEVLLLLLLSFSLFQIG